MFTLAVNSWTLFDRSERNGVEMEKKSPESSQPCTGTVPRLGQVWQIEEIELSGSKN